MTTVLAIDPGNTESGWALVDAATCRPIQVGKIDNHALRDALADGEFDFDRAAIEMVASYGMAVGADVFETCVWIGRFTETLTRLTGSEPPLVYRREVKMHHCHSGKANDSNIKQALIDRFARGVRNHGKGTKADPGWFYGFAKDMWQAYALAVQVADTIERRAA